MKLRDDWNKLVRFKFHVHIIRIDIRFKICFQKLQNNVNRIHLECSGLIEILDMIVLVQQSLKRKELIKIKTFNKMWAFSNIFSICCNKHNVLRSVCNSVTFFVIPLLSYTELWYDRPSKTNILSIALLFHLLRENKEDLL